LVARAGYPISGTLHLLVAYIIVRIAFGSTGDADQSGALTAIATTRGGIAALWVVAFGMSALALWRVAEALIGLHPYEAGNDRGDRESSTGPRLSAWPWCIRRWPSPRRASRSEVGRRAVRRMPASAQD
jgi:hypothetical protein